MVQIVRPDRPYDPARRVDLGWVEFGFIVATLFWFTHAWKVVFLPELYASATTNVPGLNGGATLKSEILDASLLWVPAYICVLGLCVRRYQLLTFHLLNNITLMLLITWLAASIVWSVDPNKSIRQVIALLFTTAFGYYLGVRLQQTKLLSIICVCFTFVLGLSFILVFLFPDIGIHRSLNDYWRGVFWHKNLLGQFCIVSTGAFLVMFLTQNRLRIYSFAGLCASVILLSFSGSATALVVAITMPFVFFFGQLRARYWLSAGVLAVSTVALAVLIEGRVAEVVFDLLGRDATLTGRTRFWAYSWQAITEKFWVGYGLRAYFDTTLLGPTYVQGGSHNGLLDLWIDGGFVAVAIFLVCYIGTLIRAANPGSLRDRPGRSWSLLYLVSFGILSTVESTLVLPNSFIWVLFVAVYSSLNKPRPGHDRSDR